MPVVAPAPLSAAAAPPFFSRSPQPLPPNGLPAHPASGRSPYIFSPQGSMASESDISLSASTSSSSLAPPQSIGSGYGHGPNPSFGSSTSVGSAGGSYSSIGGSTMNGSSIGSGGGSGGGGSGGGSGGGNGNIGSGDKIVMPDSELIALAKKEIDASREARRNAGTADTKEVQPGITIDLGHKNIQRLPEEVIDVIKDEIERLALSHNQVSTFPERLAECTRLRYLNVRYNYLREFPSPILNLASLEILDISKNRIKVLPEELGNLTSLKVFAIQRNKIEKLPLCLGDISSLSVLKLDGNPLVFPPPEICSIRKDAHVPASENEKDAVITSQVKRYLRQISTRERLKVDSEGESSESAIETPKPPKRAGSGRFPVRPSISNLEGFETANPDSPAGSTPGSAQLKNHIRITSQHNSAVRRQKVPHLSITNDRTRGPTEAALPSAVRQKRMGIVTQNQNSAGLPENVDVSTLDGTSRRMSHFHSLSHESALQHNANPRDPVSRVRQMPAQRLSDLMEHKRRSRAPDMTVEAAKGIRYLLLEMMDPVCSLIPCFKSSNLQKFPARFTLATSEVERLSQLLSRWDTLAEEDEEEASEVSKLIRSSCRVCLDEFVGVAEGIFAGAADIAANGNPRIIRTFLLRVYGSMIELRNCCAIMGIKVTSSRPQSQSTTQTARESRSSSLQQHRSITPTQSHPEPTTLRRLQAPPPFTEPSFNGTATLDASGMPLVSPRTLNGTLNGYSDQYGGLGSATPRSGESFGNLNALTRTNTMQSLEEVDENRLFENIHHTVMRACYEGCDRLPPCKQMFMRLQDGARGDGTYGIYERLIEKTNEALTAAKALEGRVKAVHLNDAMAPYQPDFWRATTAYVKAWSDLAASTMKVQKDYDLITDEIKHIMRPIQKEVKTASTAILNSPWSRLAGTNPSTSAAAAATASAASQAQATAPFSPTGSISSTASITSPPSGYPSISIPQTATQQRTLSSASALSHLTHGGGLHASMPQTPLSAALGPAAQATMGSNASGGDRTATPSLTSATSIGSGSSWGFVGPYGHGGPGSVGGVGSGFGYGGHSQSSSRVFEKADRLLSSTSRRL